MAPQKKQKGVGAHDKIPDEHVAMIRPSRWGFGLNILTTTHPRIPPNKKVRPMFTGINHLIEGIIAQETTVKDSN